MVRNCEGASCMAWRWVSVEMKGASKADRDKLEKQGWEAIGSTNRDGETYYKLRYLSKQAGRCGMVPE